jgi:hypothetical protein
MHTTIDYSNSPAKIFDAVEDIKAWLGQTNWDRVSPAMAKITNPRQFDFYAALAGVSGYPVEAWYELYHGQGSWKKAWDGLLPDLEEPDQSC